MHTIIANCSVAFFVFHSSVVNLKT